MTTIKLDPQRGHYVLQHADGVSCFGFDNARDHTNQIAERLNRPDLHFADSDHGAESGYRKYRLAVDAWSTSPQHEHTYFDPGTHPDAQRALETCRRRGTMCRLILGDPETGESWFDENDVVGRVGRSCGALKVPLLVPPGEDGGPAILTACLLAVIDWKSGKAVFRHPLYCEPELGLFPETDGRYRWSVRHRDKTLARFADLTKAAAYLAFMRGATIEPRVFA
ncbi:hypothetical protein [Sphaerotilus sp.]|uniref:hypothetical protein n=1 Tax=Sphaerotilus sp. TaxID=2093942 RepID=UPI002ACEB7D1|nr:hypothetical protein [Sphaerotilus sp.]MDZ7855759.1 hypothetical protein [Sphaerotilus sp.]